jgi:hypothetical protein
MCHPAAYKVLTPAGPFQQEVTQTLRLKNPHSDPVAFKVSSLSARICSDPGRQYANSYQVKTTAPKQYDTRPPPQSRTR